MSDTDPPSFREISAALDSIALEIREATTLAEIRSDRIDATLRSMDGEMGSLKNTFQSALEGNHQKHAETHHEINAIMTRIDHLEEQDRAHRLASAEILAEIRDLRKSLATRASA